MPVARIRFGLALLLSQMCSAAGASAQERLHLEEFPDEKLYETTLQRRHDESHDALRLQGLVGGSASLAPGTDVRFGTPFLGFGLGVWSSPMRFLQIYSELSRPIVVDALPTATSALRWSDFEGAHRGRAVLGLGKLEAGETGADLEVEGSLVHASPWSTSFLRRDLPIGPFWDGEAKVTAWPRLAKGSEEAFVMPLSYGVRKVAYGAEGTQGYTSQRVSSGVGIREYVPHMAHGWFEFVGGAWESTQFDSARRGLSRVDRVDLRFFGVDKLFGSPESDLALSFSSFAGGSWLWDAATRKELGTFAFAFAVGLRGVTNRDRNETFSMGFGVSHRAGFLADGSALTERWRFEAYSATSLYNDRVGGSIRAAVEQDTLHPIDGDERSAGYRSVFTGEWFIALVPGLQLGVSHTATDRCPIGMDVREWCHQLGIFARARGQIVRRGHEEAAEAKERDRAPARERGKDRDEERRDPE